VLLLEQRESERMSRRSDNPLAKVIVRNYPLTTPEKELRDMFEKIGKIDDFFMPQYKDTRKPRGFFFVQYRKEEDAHDAIKNLNGNVRLCNLYTPPSSPSPLLLRLKF
jgi:RNA recognition motif-containing protein